MQCEIGVVGLVVAHRPPPCAGPDLVDGLFRDDDVVNLSTVETAAGRNGILAFWKIGDFR